MRMRSITLLVAASLALTADQAFAQCDLGETGVGRSVYEGEAVFVAVSSIKHTGLGSADDGELKAVLTAKSMMQRYISADDESEIAGMVTIETCHSANTAMARVAWSPRLASTANFMDDAINKPREAQQ